MRNALIILTLIFCVNGLIAQDQYHQNLQNELQNDYGLPPGNWIFSDSEAANLASDFFYGSVIAQDNPVAGQDFSMKVSLDITEVSGQPWASGYGLNSQSAVEAGDACLLVIWLRAPGGGTVNMAMQNNVTFEGQLYLSPPLGDEWVRLLVPFIAEETLDAGSWQFSMQLNFQDQLVEIGGLNVLNYGTTAALEDLPSELGTQFYGGYEADAPWRAEAADRIEQYRKADITINVVGEANIPILGAAVEVRMLAHDFEFGTAVAVQNIAGNSLQNNDYEAHLLDLDGQGHTFNSVVFENATKWRAWEENWFGVSKDDKVNTVQWLQDRDFRVRGHTLIWPSWNNLPSDLEANQDDPNYLLGRVEDHIEAILTYPGLEGIFTDWDVLNEISVLNDLANAMEGAPGYPTGREIYQDIFNLYEQWEPNSPAVLNDYTVFGGGSSPQAAADLKQYIEELQNAGIQIDHIGFQGHIGVYPTSILEVYDILEDFSSSFGTGTKITEFDMKPETGEEVAADYLRDFYTICFSHPSTDAILMWGFWDGNHWFNNAPIYDEGWNLKPSGQAFFDLVFDEWWTEESGTTDANGDFGLSAFKGTYEIAVDCGGVLVVDTISHLADAEVTIHCTDVVSVVEPAEEIKLQVYPNPATESIRIEWLGGNYADLMIYDQAGRAVFRQTAVTSGILLNPQLSTGLYELVLIVDDTHYVQQVVFE